MKLAIEVVGWIGATLIIAAYALLKRPRPQLKSGAPVH